jgi:ATP-dependent RNA helicase DeaD
MKTFEELGISKNILKAIEELGFTEPSEIQEKVIPLAIAGKDIIGGSATGSGKTLAFGASIIEHAKPGHGLQALILVPTRELAEQVSESLKIFSKYHPITISAIYGGVDINPQIKKLRTSDVVVGTPGRILDHLSRGTIDFSKIKAVVLDEADRMLDMGFHWDVEKILKQCPVKRQTLLFSATISSDIDFLAKKYMINPVEISVESYVDPELLAQIYYDVSQNLKFSLLVHLLKHENANLVMVFCSTRINADFIGKNLRKAGINALVIHGGLTQNKRSNVMDNFHEAEVNVLVCTDIAARGLDIKGVSHVYNYDIPKTNKEYIHRIGRTARAGAEGKAVNLVSSRDYDNFRKVLSDHSLKIKQEALPKLESINISFDSGFRERSYGDRINYSGRNQRRYQSHSRYGRSEGRSFGRRNDNRSYNREERSNPRNEGREERRSFGRDSRRNPRFGRRNFGSRSNRQGYHGSRH